MAVFKVALVQMKAAPNNIEENMRLALRYIEQSSELGADIVLFPEMWSNGYAPPFEGALDFPNDERFEAERQKWLGEAVDLDSEYISSIRKAAKENKIGVVATFMMKTDGKPKNTAVLIGRDGEILLLYSKVHTCDFSLEGLLQSGDEFKVCEFDGVKIGIMICFDREFPESARVLMLKGAEIILVPNACDMNPARLGQLSTRAFENMTGVAMANYPGEKFGNSVAYSPVVFDENGNYTENCIVRASDTEEKIVIAEFDMEKLREYRKNEVWGNAFRKVYAYDVLLSKDVNEPFIR